MGKSIKVQAKSEKEAIKKVKEQISVEIDPSAFNVELVKKARNILGMGNKTNTYLVEYDEVISKNDEEYLDSLAEVDLNGEYRIKINSEGIFLKVDSPEGNGDPVSLHELKQELDKMHIEEVDTDRLRKVIADADSQWHKIAPRKPELDRDAKVDIQIGKEKLKAFIDYEPPLGGDEISYDDLKNILNEAGVIYGLKEDRLRELLREDEVVENYLIAEGKKPVAGEDGELVYHISTEGKSAGKMREDGSMDFYDLDIINNVKEGEVLATIKEPVPGKPGKAVTGKEIAPPKPREATLPSGKNVRRKDKKTLVATKAGHAVQTGRKLNVLPIYKVNGDVDLSTGKIDFVGSVYVGGSVLNGLEINAGGDIEIRGNVEAADLISKGNIVVHKGFIGKDKAEIKAEGDVKLKFVENGIINAKGNIRVKDTIMHSKINAGGVVKVKDGKGLLVGGNIRATKEIEANIIGSSLGTKTILESGVDPESIRKLAELETEIETLKANFRKTKKGLKILKNIMEKTGRLPTNKKKIYKKLARTVKQLREDIPDRENEYEELNEKISNVKRGRVIAHNKVFSGTQIKIGNYQKNIKDSLSSTAFIKEAGEIIQVSI